jgi:hypothetical protein
LLLTAPPPPAVAPPAVVPPLLLPPLLHAAMTRDRAASAEAPMIRRDLRLVLPVGFCLISGRS